MLITCPDCTTSYEVDPSTLGPTGRSVRCMRCRHVWFAANGGGPDAHPADIEATAPSAQQTSPESLPPPHAADGAGAEPPPDAEAADAGPLAPDGPLQSPPEPHTIAAGPPIVPMHAGELALPVAGVWDASLADAEPPAAPRAGRRSARRHWRLPRPGWPTAILALVALNLALLAFRAEVVRFLPQTGSLYAAIGLPVNLRGLVFSDVTTATETNDGVQVLVVEGTIASTAKRVIEVPRLRFAIRNESGHEIYTWTTAAPKNALAPGATLVFRSRLASPPREGSDVLVRFFNQRDRVAGIQ